MKNFIVVGVGFLVASILLTVGVFSLIQYELQYSDKIEDTSVEVLPEITSWSLLQQAAMV